MSAFLIGTIILVLLGIYMWMRSRREGFESGPFTMEDDKMLLSVRPDLCSMYTNATDCKGGCSWNAATGMCQPGAAKEGFGNPMGSLSPQAALRHEGFAVPSGPLANNSNLGVEGFTSPKCAMYNNCADCNKESSCGWCGGAEKCMDKSEIATLCTGTGNTPVADVASCCTRRTDCAKCTGEEDCGWCKKTSTCLLADRLGTSAGKCNPETDFATFPSNCAAPSTNFGSGGTFTPPWEIDASPTTTTGAPAPAPTPTGGITLDQYNELKRKLITDIIAELKGM